MAGIPLEQLEHLLVVERFRVDAVDCPVRYDVWRKFALSGPDVRAAVLLERTDHVQAPGSQQIAAEISRRAIGVAPSRAHLQIRHVSPPTVALTSTGGSMVRVPAPEDTQLPVPLAFGEWILVQVDLFDLVTVVLPLTGWSSVVAHLADQSEAELAERLRPPFPPNELPSVVPEPVAEPGAADPRLAWLGRVLVRLWGIDPDLASERQQGAIELRNRLQVLAGLPAPADVSEGGWSRAIATINLDRRGGVATSHSIRAVKADAARSLFSIDCSQLTWAVIDSGIDARHPAFRGAGVGPELRTRVTLTLDFTKIRDYAQFSELRNTSSFVDAVNNVASVDAPKAADDQQYERPFGSHGTHVAGILAGGPLAAGEEPLGMCPTLNLWDLRVVDEVGDLLEHRVLLALQYIREYNRVARANVGVAGANISLSIPYDPRTFACGWTAVCAEVRKLVRSGVVVVAAAGNAGFDKDAWQEGGPGRGFSSIGITDPGNTEEAITVGATHRFEAYRYGASYFSSKGPTADGRPKPDVLAPGEHIVSAIGRNGTAPKDGTSQAAPHVSGAAALLMARHPELRNEPEKVKAVLCRTATDLSRDRYFQGAGMLDILRAVQAV